MSKWHSIPPNMQYAEKYISDNDIPSLYREYLSAKTSFVAIGCIMGILFILMTLCIFLLSNSISMIVHGIMFSFIVSSTICCPAFIKAMQDMNKLCKTIMFVISDEWQMSYYEVLVKLDMMNMKINLSENQYRDFKYLSFLK